MTIEVHDEFIPEETYAEFLARMPEVCVEVVVEHGGGVLLAKRENEPAKGEWFWPGGRLYKGEETAAAAERIAAEELGIEVEVVDLLGVYSHFWETSAVGDGPSRHTVNVAYRVAPAAPDPEIVLDDQHSDHRLLTGLEPGLHEYVRRYVEEAGLLR